MQSLLSHGTNDYFQLKEALYYTYSMTIDQSIQDLSQVPELGDKLRTFRTVGSTETNVRTTSSGQSTT